MRPNAIDNLVGPELQLGQFISGNILQLIWNMKTDLLFAKIIFFQGSNFYDNKKIDIFHEFDSVSPHCLQTT